MPQSCGVVSSGRGSAAAFGLSVNGLRQGQARQCEQLERAYRLGEVDRLAPLTAEMELALIELSHFEALVQKREALELIEDALQRSMFDGGGLYIRLPENMRRQLQSSARQ
jgi:hypothetical protein